MRRIRSVGVVAVAIIAMGCGGDESGEPAATAPADAGSDAATEAGDAGLQDAQGSYSLTVVNGYGSGTYAVGQTVHIWAAVRPWTEMVKSWAGDIDTLQEPNEWHTTLTMPPRDVQVEALIKVREEAFEASVYKGATEKDKTVIRHLPEQPRGVVLMLHGTGGSARIIDKPEARYLALTAIARGYGVLVTEAEEVVSGDANEDGKIRWNPALTSGNVDFANLDVLIGSLRDKEIIGSSVPLFVLGMSNGGAMSVALGAVGDAAVAGSYPNLRFAAALSFCASGRADAAAVTTTPTGWLLCENDDNDQVDNDAAVANSAALEARGVATFAQAHPASPLYDQRFMRVPDVDEATSVAAADELRAGGFVGSDGFFVVSTAALAEQIKAAPTDFPVLMSLPGGTLSLVVNQVRVMQAEHQLYSDWASRAVDFFDAR